MSFSFSVARTAPTPPSILYGLVRRTQNGSALGQDAATVLDVERAGEVLGQALPAVTESDEAVTVLDLALAHDRPDHGIEPRAVATAGQHSDSHQTLLAVDGPASSSRRPRPAAVICLPADGAVDTRRGL